MVWNVTPAGNRSVLDTDAHILTGSGTIERLLLGFDEKLAFFGYSISLGRGRRTDIYPLAGDASWYEALDGSARILQGSIPLDYTDVKPYLEELLAELPGLDAEVAGMQRYFRHA